MQIEVIAHIASKPIQLVILPASLKMLVKYCQKVFAWKSQKQMWQFSRYMKILAGCMITVESFWIGRYACIGCVMQIAYNWLYLILYISLFIWPVRCIVAFTKSTSDDEIQWCRRYSQIYVEFIRCEVKLITQLVNMWSWVVRFRDHCNNSF